MMYFYIVQGRFQDFKLGGGANFKKLRRAEGGAKNVGVFRVKNHYFMPKNLIFFKFMGGGVRAFIYMYSKSRFKCVFCRRIVKARKVDRALRNVFCIATLSIVIYVDNRGGSRGTRIRKFEKIRFFGMK
jgi:hypothetical protein